MSLYFMNRIFILFASTLLLITSLWGCSTAQMAIEKIKSIDVPNPAVVYKIEIVQGNFVSAEQVAALRPGMQRAQVKNILGTPLLTDLFHADRWDYVFTISRDGKTSTPRKLAVFFKGESLARWEGDEMPSESEFVKALSAGRKPGIIPPLAASDKQLADAKARESAASVRTTPEVARPTPNKVFPPLEAQ
jgi:outer membrane protein assembly factor BamE